MNTAVTTEVKPASPGQLFEIGSTISIAIIKLLEERKLAFDQAEILLHEEGKIVISNTAYKTAENLLALAPIDPVAKYKKDLKKFFSEMYGLRINMSALTFPVREGFAHYMVKPVNLDANMIFAGFEGLRLPSSKYMSGSIVEQKKLEQQRPAETYVFAHKGGAEPDADHVGKSYDDFSTDGGTYLTIDEYMLIKQFMWWKFEIQLDQKGWTRTTTLDSDDGVMYGHSDEGGCRIGLDDRDWRGSSGGPRSVVIF